MDGPGANGLRGGKPNYPSGKTAIGVWLDSKGGPSGYKRGFHSDDFETEGQHAQKGAQFDHINLLYGAELPKPEHLHRKPPKASDLFNPLYSKEPSLDYMTNTTTQFADSYRKIVETHLPKSNMSRDELVNYQKTWCSDTPASRTMRFQTENRRAGNAANKNFQTPSLRLLPGTPRVLESYRSKLLEMYGVLALAVFRHHIGKGEMSCQEWKTRLLATGIKLYPHEVNQILAYFTPTETIEVSNFIDHVVAKSGGYIAKDTEATFERLFGAGERVSAEDIASRLRGEEFPEIAEGLQAFVSAYQGADGMYGVAEFGLIHSDMYACTDKAVFEDLVKDLWG
jgi:hypothetical protein